MHIIRLPSVHLDGSICQNTKDHSRYDAANIIRILISCFMVWVMLFDDSIKI